MDALTDDGLTRIEQIVAAAVEQGQAPGIVAAVARGDDVHVAVAGVATLGGPPMRRDTLVRIASITKFAPLGMTDTAFATSEVERLATFYARVDGRLTVSDPPDGQWSRPPAFGDGSGGLVSSVDDVVRFGRMLARGGDPVLTADAVADMTRNQLSDDQRRNDLPGFDLLGDAAGWGLGLAVHADGRYTWDGGFGTAWSNLPSHDLTVVVLTQRAWDDTGPPAVCADVLAAAKEACT